MRKVLIGTPSYDGKVDVWYANSLMQTMMLSTQTDIQIAPVYMAYDSLVQRARNDLVKLAIEGEFDDLIFIDSDIEWNPEWVFKLLSYDVDVVGGIYPKKTDLALFPVKLSGEKIDIDEKGLAEVDGLATGFMRISVKALKKVWDKSKKYNNEGKECRMVFDIAIENGDLVSEDIVFCRKWQKLGGKVYLDVNMTCNHVGVKKYAGNFAEYLKYLNERENQDVS